MPKASLRDRLSLFISQLRNSFKKFIQWKLLTKVEFIGLMIKKVLRTAQIRNNY